MKLHTKKLQQQHKLIYLLHLISISLILPYILQTCSSKKKKKIYKYIYTYFSCISQTPYLTKHIYFLPSPYILKDIKHSSKNMLQKPFLWKSYIHNAKSPSYERQKFIILKALVMEDNITHI